MVLGKLPKMYSDEIVQKELKTNDTEKHSHAMVGYVDSDWAGDTAPRKSVTGIAIMFSGAVIA